ncbi:MAG: D-alanyl-D-alanine carboxypeptidase [Clostridia bacterium]|nr:D-alanyl-D-alanine carboxypeptidase [Clostridia bacterium]NCC43843.1 D-alanyl-D-alanine carboxypeptidase [Clostridia bacterium]
MFTNKKSINNKTVKKKSIKKKSASKKWKTTLILGGILIATAALGITAIIFVNRSSQKDMSMAFDATDELYGMYGDQIQVEKADSFASGLCVTSQNISLEGVSASKDAKEALFDLDHEKVLFAQGIHEKAYPASITKIMTAIVALKYGNMDDAVTITEGSLNLEEGSTEIGFQVGDQVTMDELFHGLLIYSGNDAAMAIAEHVGGSVDQFVEMMNQEALELGATNTHFVNPSGLHDENHYTTAYDIYLMLKEALTYEHFVEVTQLSVYNLTYTRGEETLVSHLDSTDQYLTRQVTPPKNVTILGGKTGTTSDAGSCLALISQNAYGEPFISIVLHAPTKSVLYDNMNQLLARINS